jgi:predicted ArsR family transcriptional regulator
MSTSKDEPPDEALIATIDRTHRDLATATVAFQESVARRLGMTAAERKCLGVLAECSPTTPGHLAAATGLTTGAITGIVNRLVAAGFIERAGHPSDGRSRLLHLRRADELDALTRPVFGALGSAIRAMARDYDDAELHVIARYLDDTIGVLRDQMTALQTGERAVRLAAGARRKAGRHTRRGQGVSSDE